VREAKGKLTPMAAKDAPRGKKPAGKWQAKPSRKPKK
jgi:hypothetical protein